MKTDYDKPIKIDLIKLADLIQPFKSKIWINCKSPITKKDIEKYLSKKNLQSPDVKVQFDYIWDISTKDIHLKRVAWLVKNFSDKYPISLDFGMTNFEGYFNVDDGYHRLLAAYYLNKKYIKANCSGSIKEIKKYLYKP